MRFPVGGLPGTHRSGFVRERLHPSRAACSYSTCRYKRIIWRVGSSGAGHSTHATSRLQAISQVEQHNVRTCTINLPKKSLSARTQTHPTPARPTLRAALHARRHRCTQPLKWQRSGTDSLRLSTCAGNILTARPGAGLQHPNATRHAIREATSQLLPRGRGTRCTCTDANPQPSYTPRRSGSREGGECVRYIPVEPAHVRVPWNRVARGTYRETLLQTLSGWRQLYCLI